MTERRGDRERAGGDGEKGGCQKQRWLTSRGGGVTDRERGCQRKETEEKCSAKDRAVVD